MNKVEPVMSVVPVEPVELVGSVKLDREVESVRPVVLVGWF